MNYRIVSYYTRKTIYETIMLNYLMPCLHYLKIPYSIFIVQDCGKWETNASFQPEMIWRAMKTFENENIVWMDADVIVQDVPLLFEQIPARCDIGVYYLKHEDHWGGVPPGVQMPKPLLNTGVIYFKNSPKMLAFVEEWMLRCSKAQGTSHRIHLAELIDDRINDDLSFFLLPRGYAYVAEREDGKMPAEPMKFPLVIQFQASVFGKKDLYDHRPFQEPAK